MLYLWIKQPLAVYSHPCVYILKKEVSPVTSFQFILILNAKNINFRNVFKKCFLCLIKVIIYFFYFFYWLYWNYIMIKNNQRVSSFSFKSIPWVFFRKVSNKKPQLKWKWIQTFCCWFAIRWWAENRWNGNNVQMKFVYSSGKDHGGLNVLFEWPSSSFVLYSDVK